MLEPFKNKTMITFAVIILAILFTVTYAQKNADTVAPVIDKQIVIRK